MTSGNQNEHSIRFGEFELHLRTRELQRNGDRSFMQEQPFQVLLMLLERPGDLVTREELTKRLWPADTFVDFEHSLNKAVKRLREVLGDSAETPRFIETLPRQGYRFVAPVTQGHTQQQGAVPFESFFSFLRKPSQLLRWAAMAVAICLLAFGALLYERPWASVQLPKPLVERSLTANPSENSINCAVISPDGRTLAYSDAKNGTTLLQIDSGESRLLLTDSNLCPFAWYPDGVHLLVSGSERGLWKISTFDGSTHKLLDESEEVDSAAVSPDGKHIAFVKRSSSDLWTMGSDGEAPKRILTISSTPNATIREVAWSHTSQRLLYSWLSLATENRKVEATIASCDPDGTHGVVVLTDDRLRNRDAKIPLSWSPDGRVFFHLQEPPPNDGNTNIWAVKVDPDTGRVLESPSRVTSQIGFTDGSYSQSADGKRLIYQKQLERDAIQVAEFDKGTGQLKSGQEVGQDNWHRRDPQWTADGQNLLFDSNPQGSAGIFRYNLHTREIRPLVSGSLKPIANVNPVAAFGGKWLLFNRTSARGVSDSTVQLMRMPLAGGPAVPILNGRFSYQCASAANVCVLSELNGHQRSFSLLDPVAGRGPVIGHVDTPSISPDYGWSLAPDGKNIAFIPRGTEGPEIDILSIDGKTPTRKITVDGARFQSLSWSPDNRRLYVTNAGSPWVWEILAVDLNGKCELLLRNPQADWIVYPMVSPDGRFLAYQLRTLHANIVMLESY